MNKNRKLIYDVGMHKGEDTDYYLKKGFNVVGFEADPDLAAFCRQRFLDQIKTNQLTIVEGAIVDCSNNDIEEKVVFFKNKLNSVWGTVDKNWAERNEYLGSKSEKIKVPIVDFSKCLRQYGMPYYLKVDIEGMDIFCLKSLKDFRERPDFISIESEMINFEILMEEFRIFKELGYTSFQVVNQSNIASNKEPKDTIEGKFVNYNFLSGSTGLFGNDLNKKNWKSYEESIKHYRRIFNGYKYFGNYSQLNKFIFGRIFCKFLHKLFGFPGWYDTHAKHSSVKP